MADLLRDLSQKVKALGADWSKYVVVGTGVLYLVGYLALRFHLTVLGVGTDLAVLDERYLFTGGRFAVHLLTSLANVIFVALLLLLLGQAVPARVRARARKWIRNPARAAAVGIVLAIALIQLVMRQCFGFSNLLVADHLPDSPGWIAALMLRDSPSLYFDALVAGLVVTAALLWSARAAQPPAPPAPPLAVALLGVLLAIEAVLLPVNYGVFIVDKSLARVTAVGDKALADGEQAWLAWEGKDGVTWLVGRGKGPARRTLTTLPRADVKRIEIVGYDRIFPKLFGPAGGGS